MKIGGLQGKIGGLQGKIGGLQGREDWRAPREEKMCEAESGKKKNRTRQDFFPDFRIMFTRPKVLRTSGVVPPEGKTPVRRYQRVNQLVFEISNVVNLYFRVLFYIFLH